MKYGVFTGNYEHNMVLLFDRATKYLGLEPGIAHKLCENWAADAGRMLAEAKKKVDYSKLKGKDNKIDLKLAAKVTGITPTFPISIDQLLGLYVELFRYGMHSQNSILVLNENLAKYVAELEPAKEAEEPEVENKEEAKPEVEAVKS